MNEEKELKEKRRSEIQETIKLLGLSDTNDNFESFETEIWEKKVDKNNLESIIKSDNSYKIEDSKQFQDNMLSSSNGNAYENLNGLVISDAPEVWEVKAGVVKEKRKSQMHDTLLLLAFSETEATITSEETLEVEIWEKKVESSTENDLLFSDESYQQREKIRIDKRKSKARDSSLLLAGIHSTLETKSHDNEKKGDTNSKSSPAKSPISSVTPNNSTNVNGLFKRILGFKTDSHSPLTPVKENEIQNEIQPEITIKLNPAFNPARKHSKINIRKSDGDIQIPTDINSPNNDKKNSRPGSGGYGYGVKRRSIQRVINSLTKNETKEILDQSSKSEELTEKWSPKGSLGLINSTSSDKIYDDSNEVPEIHLPLKR